MTKKQNTSAEDFLSDEQLLAFFDAKEAGKSFPEALNASGVSAPGVEETGVLRSLWEMHGGLMKHAHNMSPKRELLERIIGSIDGVSAAPAKSEGAGHRHAEYVGGASADGFRKYANIIKKFNWGMVAPVIVVFIVFVSIAGKIKNPPMVAPLAVNESSERAAAVPSLLAVSEKEPVADALPEAKIGTSELQTFALASTPFTESMAIASINAFAATLDVDMNADAAILNDTDGEIQLVVADGQSISGFTNAYDETTF